MSEKTKYEGYVKKLQGLCEEHDLTYRLRLQEYPMSLTIRPVQGIYEQMSMLEKDEGVLSPDAYLRFEIRDGEVSHRTGGTFVISDVLFTKLRSLFRNIEYRWLQFFFRDIIEREALSKDRLPVISEDEDEQEDDDDSAGMAWDEQIKLATAIVRAENDSAEKLLEDRLAISFDEATAILDELENLGVIDEAGNVLPWDEPDEQEETEEVPEESDEGP